jgi:hypothetical protein
MLPSNSPVLIRVRRLHDKLFAGECEYARQLFAWQRPHQCALNVEGESVSVCINLIGAIGGLVTALRILHRRSVSPWLRIAIHHLNGHVAIARIDQQPGTVSFVNLPVCIRLFEPCQSSPPNKAVLDALAVRASPAAGQGQEGNCAQAGKQEQYAR